MCCLHPLSSLCVACVFILLVFSLSIADLTYIVPQATAYTNTFGNSLNVLNTQSHDSNQNLIAQTVAKIYLERSGGFAGFPISTTVDIHSLPPDEANKIQGMIDNAKGFFYQPSKLTPAPPQAADYFKYKITVQTEEGMQNTIETNDITMPSELRPLINYLVNLLPKSSK
jgi:hypothetical protein